MSILFISNNNFSSGLSGGDRIFLELLRLWSKIEPCGLMGSVETKALLDKYKLPNIKFYQTSGKNHHVFPNTYNIVVHQISRTVKAKIYTLLHLIELTKYTTVYSVSDFFPDLIPALIIKIFKPNIKLICGFYLLAPNPNDPNSPYIKNHQVIKNYLYFYFQKINLLLIKLFANIVFVTSDPDIKLFSHKKVVVVRGGVDTTTSSKWLSQQTLKPPKSRKFLACFVGRLHPQKGILILIDIWKLVVAHYPKAKLAIIGNGQLEEELIAKINQLKLNKNIQLFGFVDGLEKESIFRDSAIIVHPATFDSGGMAAAEAMAWGLPGVSFDLLSLKSYYPKGMIKAKKDNLVDFADNIIKLYRNPKLYKKISNEATTLIQSSWEWSQRAQDIYSQIN
ncbi:glycosyltransferase [Candidatus Shapirobacteria bacterium]|nr:glycosyltransferase [Candidatus Shapirobacteria bacterium]